VIATIEGLTADEPPERWRVVVACDPVTAEDEVVLQRAAADPWGPGARWGERIAGTERIVEELRAAEGTEVLLTPTGPTAPVAPDDALAALAWLSRHYVVEGVSGPDDPRIAWPDGAVD
jgi:hypothetical protein